MSGFGERFRRAGYRVPKPLIEIDGKPVIAHVLAMFPGETDVTFVCNRDHLDHPDYRMEATLRTLCPTGRIAAIAPHTLGPVHAVQQVAHLLDPNKPVVVNYCDFTCYWDWTHFKQFVAQTQCAGAIPAYKGFHPHTLGSTHYAYMREADGWVQDIQEKQPYTDNRMQEYASSGTYYFASAARMQDAFARMRAQRLTIGEEYYVSLAYKPILADHLPVAVYPLQHFMQWGTPEDVAEYEGWSRAFRGLIAEVPPAPDARGSLVIPMAGLGQRFAKEGYALTKPLIAVSGRPMVAQATHDLPAATQHAFVLRRDMQGYADITTTLQTLYPKAVIETVPEVTEGQAISARLGLEALQHRLGEVPGPVTFGACDYGALYDAAAFATLVDNPDIDVIVWAVRGHANAVRHPSMYGWIDADATGRIQRISVKTPLASPATDPIVLGTFTFRRAADFERAVGHLLARAGRINGEFYLDSCINDALALGLSCYIFEVDSFFSWGTPNDLRTFEYWQSCFHKWAGHPYRLELDRRVARDALASLEARYQKTIPPVPKSTGRIKRELAIFLIVGLLTVLVDFITYRGLVALQLLGTDTAKGCGFIAGTIFAYFANRFWTFGHHTHAHRSALRFALLYATTMAINIAINAAILALAHRTAYAVQLAFLMATAVSACLNFLGMKFFVFTPSAPRVPL